MPRMTMPRIAKSQLPLGGFSPALSAFKRFTALLHRVRMTATRAFNAKTGT